MLLGFYRAEIMKALGHKLIERAACPGSGMFSFGVSVAG